VSTVEKQLGFIIEGADVQRFHTVRTVHPETVGEHSFFVAWLCYLINPAVRVEAVMNALSHDLAEHLVGDIPAPAKRELKVGAEVDALENKFLNDVGLRFTVTVEERVLIKTADCISGMLTCLRERRMGNRINAIIFDRYADYLLGYKLNDPAQRQRAERIIKYVTDHWNQHTPHYHAK
jgi:5'-deoxynucleotidase YfbR-like HD superfamily hydrolase